jgi:UDPglucose 6-dehydrogenase
VNTQTPTDPYSPADDPSAPRMTVIGTGYLGATHAVCMAILGYDVLGVDVDPAKIADLSAGRVPFFEPGLDEKLREALDSGRIRFTTDFDEAARFGDIHFVCVGTPQQQGSNDAHRPQGASRRQVDRSGRHGAAPDRPGARGVAGRRGARTRLEPRVPARGVRGRRHAAPRPPRLRCRVIADLATAELVKVAANSFLATKISYINAMAEVCEATGADVDLLATALSHDDRIGGRFLKPGLGFGGGCLPKDIRAFRHRAEELGIGQSVAFLGEVDAINIRRRERTVDLVRELAGGDLTGVRVAALGAAFKPNSDDVRDAPALDVARLLYLEGARVVVYDPEANENAHRAYPDLDYADTLGDATHGAEVVVLLTEWDEFRNADPGLLGHVVAQRRIVDARHALDAAAYRAAGWEYRALGRPDGAGAAQLTPHEKDMSTAPQ